jgi:hypothetical protein
MKPSDQAQGEGSIESIDTTSHPFVIRIWLEENARGACGARWRGHITHVPSGERLYLKDLDDIATFVMPYLEAMDVEFGLIWRTKRWLKRWRRCWAEPR